ncbi:MAG: DegQ family serine endoprotease, partial [Nitrospirota bacterium]|nr:DegQ family serine endoprotease [Nitrospirota bacterium]
AIMKFHEKHVVRLLGILTLGLALLLTMGLSPIGSAYAKDKIISQESSKLLSKLSDALAEVAEVARPAVVNISTTSTVTMEDNPMFNDPFFRRFFGDQFDHGQKRKFKSSALGSGVIISADGYILTNNHVIKGADEIKVILYDKREFKGKIVGTDPRTDLAVVKIQAKDLPTVKIGDSGKLKTGDVVLAIGNPFGLSQTITMGIVSAVGRSNIGLADFEDFIQTDAAINPGNSGGALVNTNGELVGINTAIFSTSGGYMGIGFAIPSDMARSVMDSIIKHGKVIRGWLGVSIQNLTPELAKSLGMKETAGALVGGVEKDSPADKAGMKRGDLIIQFSGKKVEDSTGLRNMVAGSAPGTKAEIKVVRDQKEQILTVTLGEFQEKKTAKKIDYNNVLKGITVQELTPSLRDRMGIPENVNGVIIANISEDSPAQEAIQMHDVIMEVNRKAITNFSDYDQAVSKIGEKDSVLLLIYRDGASIYITIKP